MPGPPRLQFPGAIYHVVTRGEGRRSVFHDDGHDDGFSDGLADEVQRSAWEVIASYRRQIARAESQLAMKLLFASRLRGMVLPNCRPTQPAYRARLAEDHFQNWTQPPHW